MMQTPLLLVISLSWGALTSTERVDKHAPPPPPLVSNLESIYHRAVREPVPLLAGRLGLVLLGLLVLGLPLVRRAAVVRRVHAGQLLVRGHAEQAGHLEHAEHD